MSPSIESAPPAALGAGGLVNLRDIGGLPIAVGGITRRGVLYRGDASYEGDAPPAHVGVWPPAAVVDLRTTAEADRLPFAWPGSTAVHQRPLHAGAVPANLRGGDIADVYGFILDSAADRVAGVVELVAGQPGPVLVHCTAGKDRTGIVVAALLLTAGVEPDAVVADYVATSANMPAVVQRLVDRGLHEATAAATGAESAPPSWAQAPAAAVSAVVDRLTSHPGGVTGWLVEHGADAAALERWRTRLSVPDAAGTAVGQDR